MNELIKLEEQTINIKDNTLQVIEYKDERVLTSYDIARLHNKEVKRVNEQFERNKERLKEGTDYFIVSVEEFAVAICDHTISNKSRHQSERLFTERGYLKLVKSFTDDLSWEIQDLLVDSYFKLKKMLSTKQSCFLTIVEASTQEEILLGLNKLNNEVIVPLEYKVEEQSKELTQSRPKINYYDIVLNCTDLITITQIAQDYGISAQKLNKILEQEEIQYKDNTGTWLLRVKYGAQGYAQTQTHVYRDSNDIQHAKLHLKWTQKGRLFIYDLLKTKGILPICELE